jgi:ABC-type Fe3+/spermidine/putrescine transport system ATPase subunit
MSALQLRDLSKQYPGAPTPALDRLSLEVRPGELVALLGASGCGKSTTLRLIAGLLAPSGGDILFDERSILAIPPERRGVGMVFQKPLLLPHMSVGENVGFGLRVRGARSEAIRRRADELLEMVQLPGMAARRPGQLSGGQEQRVALARALAVEPRLLLLDEPFSQLDASLRAEMRELVGGLQRRLGITTLLVTHDQEEAVQLADRVALLSVGRLLQFDAPRTLFERPASLVVARFFGGQNFIPGQVEERTFFSVFGALALGDALVPAGPATATIRPERIRLCSGKAGGLRGVVTGARYLGAQMRYTLRVGSQELVVLADTAAPLAPGDEVGVELPPEALWVLPGE